jgi:hypothetical protein
MNRVINGRRYDTTTAKNCGAAQVKRGGITTILTLYRKTTGEFFLCSPDDGKTFFKQLSPNMAKRWAYRHLPIDDYELNFGSGIFQDDSKQSQLLSLKKSTIEKLRIYAAEQNTTMSDIVDQLVNLVVSMKEDTEDGEE